MFWKKTKASVAATLAVLVGMPLTQQALAETLRIVVLPSFRFGRDLHDSGSDGS